MRRSLRESWSPVKSGHCEQVGFMVCPGLAGIQQAQARTQPQLRQLPVDLREVSEGDVAIVAGDGEARFLGVPRQPVNGAFAVGQRVAELTRGEIIDIDS